MPSNSFKNFEQSLKKDVERLITTHKALSKSKRGKHGLGHITRSGIFMLCAEWETYLEDLIQETLQKLLDAISGPNELDLSVQNKLATSLKNSKNNLDILKLSGDGWRSELKKLCFTDVEKFNTPKSSPVDQLYKNYIGIPAVSSSWSFGSVRIDQFVAARGEIAHRGRKANYIRIEELKKKLEMIQRTALETDNEVHRYLRGRYPKCSLWNRKTVP